MKTLKDSKEFNPIYTKGKKIHTKYAIIFKMKTNEPKFGFVTSKKVGNAVKRNRIRRIFREIVRKNKFFFDNAFSYIIVAKKNIGEDFNKINYNLLKDEILLGLKRK